MTTPATEYRLIQGTTSGERWILHPHSMTCEGPLDHAETERYLAGEAQMSACSCDLDADPAMLDDQQYRTLLVEGGPADLLRSAIDASGLSARRFASEVLFRDERTVRRWIAGDSPIPAAVIAELQRRESE